MYAQQSHLCYKAAVLTGLSVIYSCCSQLYKAVVQYSSHGHEMAEHQWTTTVSTVLVREDSDIPDTERVGSVVCRVVAGFPPSTERKRKHTDMGRCMRYSHHTRRRAHRSWTGLCYADAAGEPENKDGENEDG